MFAVDIRTLTCAGAVSFSPGLESTALVGHLADSLRAADARDVKVGANTVSFTGGVFRLTSKWNVLCPFGYGNLTVEENARQVTYRLSIRQLIVVPTIVIAFLAIFPLVGSVKSGSWGGLTFIPFTWMWVVGGNLAIGIPRFRSFVEKVVATAPGHS
jgi:hypothetical protein